MSAQNSTDQYLNGLVNFGGRWITRAEVYQWHTENGYPQQLAEVWLMGHDSNKT